MFNLVELQQQRAHKALTAKEIIDKAEKANPPRPTTDEENQIFDRLQDDIKVLDAQITAIQAHNRRSEESAALIAKLDESPGRISKPDPPGSGLVTPTAVARVPATARRTGTLKAFKPRNGESQESADMRAYRAGLWARAVLFNDPRAQQKCLNMGIQVDLRNAMSTTSNPDGGVLVPDEMSQAIIDLREEFGVFRRECRVWPMGSDTLMIPRRAGGITIGPLGENPAAAPSDTNPTFNMVQLVAKKAGGLCKLSSEIAEDAVLDLADYIASEFAYAFAEFEDTIGFTGDGSSTHLGVRGLTNLMTTASGLAGAVAAAATHDTFIEVDQSDLAKLMGKLPAYAKRNAKFYCSNAANELVFGRLKATAGGNTVQTLQSTVAENYLGYPIVISQKLPDSTGTINGTAMLFFGDLSRSSSLGDRRRVTVFPSMHRAMELDQIWILGTERIDVVNHDIGTASVAGPIVGLMGTT